MPSLCHNPDLLMHFRLLIIMLDYSVSNFLEKNIMPIRYAGTLTKTRMKIESLTFPDMVSIRGPRRFLHRHDELAGRGSLEYGMTFTMGVLQPEVPSELVIGFYPDQFEVIEKFQNTINA